MGARQISLFREKFVICKETMTHKEQVLAVLDKYYTQWESDPLRMESGYHYELTYATMMKKVEKEILQLSVGKVPKSKNTKKNSRPDLEK